MLKRRVHARLLFQLLRLEPLRRDVPNRRRRRLADVCLVTVMDFRRLVAWRQLDPFEHVRRWLRDEEVWLPTVFRGFVPGPGLRCVTLNVERRADFDDQRTPLYRVFFVYSTSIHVLHVPDANWMLPVEVTLPDIGNSPYPPHNVKWVRQQLVEDRELAPYEEFIDVAVPALRGFLGCARGGRHGHLLACR